VCERAPSIAITHCPDDRDAEALDQYDEGGAIISTWAEMATNSKAEAKVTAELKESLPLQTRRVLGDESYDDPKLRAGIERYENHLLTRCLLVPIEVKKRTSGKRRREADRYLISREFWPRIAPRPKIT
jgi:hypothetical protein